MIYNLIYGTKLIQKLKHVIKIVRIMEVYVYNKNNVFAQVDLVKHAKKNAKIIVYFVKMKIVAISVILIQYFNMKFLIILYYNMYYKI